MSTEQPRRGRPPKNPSFSPVQQMLASPIEIDDSSLLKQPESTKRPTPRDPEWTDYLMSLLAKGEKDDKSGYPKTSGLKRLVLLLFGEIVKSRSKLINSGNYVNEAGEIRFVATVEHYIEIEMHDGNSVREYVGVGGSSELNTDKPYSSYPETVASTRAYARALKDALSINCVTADELSQAAEEEQVVDLEEPASSTQRKGIESISKRLGINALLLINSGEQKYIDLQDRSLTKQVALKFVEQLNYFQGGKEIPGEIKL